MLQYIIPFLQVDVNEKLQEAPNGDYQIGIIIGTFLPFAFLAGVAWFIFIKAKNRKDLDD